MRPAVFYTAEWCPVCYRTSIFLKKLEAMGYIHLIWIDIDAVNSGTLMDKYRAFLSRVFGGEVHVPAVLLDDDKWFVPSITSTRKRRVLGEKERIEAAVRELEERFLRAISERPPLPFPSCHEAMLLAKGRGASYA